MHCSPLLLVLLLFFIFPALSFPSHSTLISLDELKVCVDTCRENEVHLHSRLLGGFIDCRMCFGRSVNSLLELPGQG